MNKQSRPGPGVLTCGFAVLLAAITSVCAEQPITVEPFSQLAQARSFEFPARVVELQQADIAAETSGRIVEFSLQVGDSVARGQTLLRIECSRANTEKARAEAGLKRLQARRDLTEQQLQRAQSLVQSRSISREELDQRQTQLDADIASIEEQQAVLQLARQAVEDCVLKAPFSGVVTQKLSAAGAYASPGKPMLTLLQPDAVELELELPTRHVDDLVGADKIIFSSNGQEFALSLRRVLPRINTTSLQQQVRLAFTTTNRPPSGAYGLVQFDSARNYLPARLVVQRNGELGYFTVEANSAVFVPLPLAQEGQAVMLQVSDDPPVITAPLKTLQSGDPVKP